MPTRPVSRFGHPATRRALLMGGLTAIFVGYFLVWLPGPGVGLQLIGLELGEWIKFLGVGSRRDLFYLPPIVLGLLLVLWTMTWPPGWGRVWLMRGLAVAVALLAFPAVAAITLEPPDQWLLRLALIGGVALAAGLSALLPPRFARWAWLLMAVVAVVGALAPTWQYLAVHPVVGDILRRPVGVGPGVWVNALGCGLVAAVAAVEFTLAGHTKRQPPEERLSINRVVEPRETAGPQ